MKHRHAVPLMLSGIIGIALVGFLVGLRHTPRVAAPPRPVGATLEVTEDAVVASLSYSEIRDRPIGRNRGYGSALSSLVSVLPHLYAPVVIPAGAKARALAERSVLRAFNGAPPTVPHAVATMPDAACRGCHDAGLVIGDSRAPSPPHGLFVNCSQCHVAELVEFGEPTPLAETTFVGLPAPTEGLRAWPGAPPEIPHSTHMRENCLACHGVLGKTGLRTTHPWRQSCLQCHAPSAELNRLPWVSEGEASQER